MTIFSFDQFCNNTQVSPTGHLLEGGLLFKGAGLQPIIENVHNVSTQDQFFDTTRELNLAPISGHKHANESMAIVRIFDEQFPDWKYIDSLSNKDIDLLSLILHVPEARACVLHNTKGTIMKTHDENGERLKILKNGKKVQNNSTIVPEIEYVKYCPRITDTYHCWPHAHPNTTTFLPCPNSYRDNPIGNEKTMQGNVVIANNDLKTRFMTKYCDPNARWSKTMFDDCKRDSIPPPPPEEYSDQNPPPKSSENENTNQVQDKSETFKNLMYAASTILAVFSCISLVCSIFAIVIFTTFR